MGRRERWREREWKRQRDINLSVRREKEGYEVDRGTLCQVTWPLFDPSGAEAGLPALPVTMATGARRRRARGSEGERVRTSKKNQDQIENNDPFLCL